VKEQLVSLNQNFDHLLWELRDKNEKLHNDIYVYLMGVKKNAAAQVEALQREHARQFAEYRRGLEIREQEKRNAIVEKEQMALELKAVSDRERELRAQLAKLRSVNSELSSENQRLESQLVQRSREMDDLRVRVELMGRLEHEKRTLESQLVEQETRYQKLVANAGKAQEDWGRRIRELETEITRLEQLIAEIAHAPPPENAPAPPDPTPWLRYKRELEELREAYEKGMQLKDDKLKSASEQITVLNEENKRVLDQLSQSRQEIMTLKTDMGRRSNEYTKLREEVDGLQARIRELVNFEQQHPKLLEKIKGLSDQLTQLGEQNNNLQTRYAAVFVELRDVRTKYTRTVEELEDLKRNKLQDRNQKDLLQVEISKLQELLSVAQKKYDQLIQVNARFIEWLEKHTTLPDLSVELNKYRGLLEEFKRDIRENNPLAGIN